MSRRARIAAFAAGVAAIVVVGALLIDVVVHDRIAAILCGFVWGALVGTVAGHLAVAMFLDEDR